MIGDGSKKTLPDFKACRGPIDEMHFTEALQVSLVSFARVLLQAAKGRIIIDAQQGDLKGGLRVADELPAKRNVSVHRVYADDRAR